jgi:hypothetical protein
MKVERQVKVLHEEFCYFLSLSQSQQAVFAEVIPNSGAEIFSPKTDEERPPAVRVVAT